MTNEQLAVMIQQGAPLMEELWSRLRAYITQAAWTYYGQHRQFCKAAGIEGCDLVQEGYLALVDAVNVYDQRKGHTFLAYMKYPLKKRFSMAGGFSRGNARLFACCASLEQQLGGGVTLGDTLEDRMAEKGLEEVEERIFIEQLRQALEKCMSQLPGEQASALRARYWKQGRAEQKLMREGLKTLRKKRYSQHLEEYREFIIERHGYSGTLESFRNTWTSSTERAVLELDRRGLLRA